MQNRTCSKCREEKPHTVEFFDVSQGRLRGTCRACRLAYARTYRQQNPDKVAAAKAASVAKNPDRYRAISKRWHEANADKVKTRLAALYRAESDKFKQRAQEWRRANPNRKRELDAAWRRANRKRMAENVAAWKVANPERWKAISRGICARRRAREAAAEGSYNADDLARLMAGQKGRCWWCNRKLTKYHADHLIPLAKGGTNGPENIVIACPTCNMRKGAKMPWEMDNPRLL